MLEQYLLGLACPSEQQQRANQGAVAQQASLALQGAVRIMQEQVSEHVAYRLILQHLLTCNGLILQHLLTCNGLILQHLLTCNGLILQHLITCNRLNTVV
jgi:hypothetical protein